MKNPFYDIHQLYIAYFNRPADADGMQYWLGVHATQEAMASAFSQTVEFQQRFAGMSNQEMVKTLYHNLFGRAGEAAGVSYWSGLLDSGALKPADVVLSLVRGARGQDATALAEKMLFAQDVMTGMKAYLPYLAADTISAVSSIWLEQVTDAATAQTARSALQKYVASPGTSTTVISGQAQGVGYLRDATVFIDSNGNGVQDATEWHTKTDANGHFLLAQSAIADFPQNPPSWDQHVLVTGGYDQATARAHNGTLSLTVPMQHKGGYPANTLVHATISATTTLRDALLRTGASADAADAALAYAFGASINAGADNLNTALDAAGGARAAALTAYALNAEIDGIAEIVARTLQMLSAKQPSNVDLYDAPKLSFDVAMRASYEAIAGVLTSGMSKLDSGAALLQMLKAATALPRLADGTVLDGAAAKSLAALSTDTLDAFQHMLAATASLARADISSTSASWTTLAHVAQVRAALDDLADVLPRAVAENKAAALLPQWTDTAIRERIAAKDIGDIDPYSQNDSAAISAANGTPPALDKLAVEQLYVAMLNRPAAPGELQKWMTSGDAAALSTELAAQPEWQGKTSAVVAVDTLYTNLFGRAADADGLLYWSGVLRDQKIDLANMAQLLVNGATGSDALAARNKVVGALEYTSELATPELAAAYTRNPAAGKAWISMIVDDATLKSALDHQPVYAVTGPVTIVGVHDTPPL